MCSGFDSENKATPPTAHTTAAHVRGATRSRRNAQPITATAAGIDAMVTPADTASVRLTP
ncbi:hypothetical protein D3C71_1784380 [compost metagenome]